MIDADDFITASPGEVAQQLDHAIHLWRLPWQRKQGRALLLALLAAYLQVDATSLRLETGPHGKPYLPDGRPLHFNWSHSGEFALLALSRDFEIGVDVEQARNNLHALELARRFFTPAEAHVLANLPENGRDASFLQLWSAKEAVLKALGHGLSFGLERIAFTPSRNGWLPGCFDTEAGAVEEWRVLPLRAAADHTGALAWRGSLCPIRALALAQ